MLKNIKIITLRSLSLLAVVIGADSCSEQTTSHKEVIFASIAPVKHIVEAIVGSDFQIEVLVPAGANPETFEPTPKQYIALNEAKAVMSVGLIEFEKSILSRLRDQSRMVNLSQGVELLEGTCSHHAHGEHHAHGVDPHIWTSPVELQQMALNCYSAIAKLYPDSLHYKRNYEALQLSLEELDTKITGEILSSGVKSFVIHHPAYTYFARDYGVEQISIQDEGKEPTTRRVGEIIDEARQQGVAQILYQKQFPATVVEVIAKDAGANVVAVDPLSEDIVSHIEEFASIITRRK